MSRPRKRKVALSHISRAVRNREQKGISKPSWESGDLKAKFDDAADRKKLPESPSELSK